MTHDLKVYGSAQKSFYGKAKEIIEGGKIYLKSYNTIVCSLDAEGNFKRHWYGYSATTMKHVNSFITKYGIDGDGKKWWDSLEVVRV